MLRFPFVLRDLDAFKGTISMDLPEPFDTLEANALAKARHVFKQIGLPVFAEDSGLFVPALGYAPGVYSARFAARGSERPSKDANMRLLLDNMEGVQDRSAVFKAAMAFVSAELCPQGCLFYGACQGHITEQIQSTQGFGYDAVFTPQGYDKTFAELGAMVKNNISHRKKALESLLKYLRSQKNILDLQTKK